MRLSFEVIQLNLFDIGRAVDMELARALTAASQATVAVTGRDTPDSLDLPRPLIVELDRWEGAGDAAAGPALRALRLSARIFDDGVVDLMLRLELDCALEELHLVRGIALELPAFGGAAPFRGTAEQLVAARFESLHASLRPAINHDQYRFERHESEAYRVYCACSPLGDPAGWVQANRHYLASFLLGEDPAISLHETQIGLTLGHPFSFRGDDLAIFDMDRCLLVDARREYEDLLLIIEHANYQLLELRTLDKLLDRRLDTAAKDAANSWHRRKFGLKRSGLKLSGLQPLRLDALFILNNLENSSKIIGDYYLCQIYDHLTGLFNTQSWKRNVERSLETLQDLYAMAKGESNERALLFLELVVVLLIAVELVIFLVGLG